MNGPVLCAGVLDRMAGFAYRTAGQKGSKHQLQTRDGLGIWDQEYRFKPKAQLLAWKQARPGTPALPTNQAQGGNAPPFGSGDWILVAAVEQRPQFRSDQPDRVLAVYSAPKGMSQQARVYFVEELGTEVETGALAVILGIIRWNYAKPAKLLSSAFSTSPGYMA